MSRFLSTITSKNVGQRRPRSDSPPDTSASAEPTTPTPSTSALVTQSPTTDRIVKRGRLADDSAGAGSPSASMPTTPTPARHVPTSTLDQRTPIAPIQLTTSPPPCAWNHCRKKVADGVRSLMTDVQHLATRKPLMANPRLFEEIYQLRSLANDLERHFYPKDIIQHTKEPTTDTLPTPPAPVEAATAKPTYATAAKAATPATVPKGPPTKKTPQKPRRPDKAPTPPTTSRSAPQRLIL
ncbi:hypothetical protein R3P38DRAFT_2913837, partial [Favolaschia claudopus]